MLKLATSAVWAVIMVGGLGVCPASAETAVNCETAMTTHELNFCGEQDLQRADAKLNAAYKKVLARIVSSDQDKPYDAKSWEAALRASQRAWVAFRDADCKDLAPMAWAGGTATTSMVLGCLAAKTKQRTQELEEMSAER